MYFGKNLQFLRKMKNLTQEELAERMNVSRQTVSKWETDTAYPELDKLIDLCDLFACSVDRLLRDDMNTYSDAYSDIRTVTVEPFCYIQYAVVSGEPEADAIAHVEGWARELGIERPLILGWDFPQVSQEQVNVFRMHGYAAALVLPESALPEGQDTGGLPAEIHRQERQKYLTISIRNPFTDPFRVIPNAYKTLFTHMETNGIRNKRDPSVLSCYEREYEADGVCYMDIYIAIE